MRWRAKRRDGARGPSSGRDLAAGWLSLAIVLCLALVGSVSADEVQLLPGNLSPADLSRARIEPAESWLPGGRSVRSWREMRDHGVVRQAYDYSCGSAALATLLSGLGTAVSEREILNAVLAGLGQEEMRQTMEAGLSLLHLKTVSEERGKQAGGYRVPPEFLAKLRAPVIVFIQPRGYRHFAVFRGIRGDRVFLADPARGNVRFPIWKFLEMWLDEQGRGVIFVVGPENLSTLALGGDEAAQPELLGVHQMMRIGTPGLALHRIP